MSYLFDPWGNPYLGPAGEWQQWWQDHAVELARDPLARRALRQGFVIVPHLVGLSSNDARRKVRRREWVTVQHGVFTPLVLPTDDSYLRRRRAHVLTATAAALRNPDHAISVRSGAIVHGLPTMHVPNRPELTAINDVRLGRRGPHVFGASVRPEDLTRWYGVPVLSVARTLVDLGRRDRRDAIMAADAALRESLVQPDELERALARAAGWPGVRQARAVLALADGRSESAAESITRLALIDDGFPHFEPQVQIPDRARGKSWRVDLLNEQARLIIEVDGLDKYRDDSVRKNEKVRETRLERLGYKVVRITWDDVVRHWPETAAEIRAELRART